MVCYHPLKAKQIGVHPSGKPKYKIYPYSEFLTNYIEVPCGRCIGCRLDYAKTWADRCVVEMQQHDSSYFATITYSDEFLPITSFLDSETGECGNMATLVKRDFQLFMKRLRKSLDYPIRFFACGEYGTTTFRPHYHAILFGLKLNDLQFYKKDGDFTYYNSAFLDSFWQKGYIVVAPANWQTCAYVAKYVTKALKGGLRHIYEDHNVIPPFTLMSRRPGIGRTFYNENADKLYLQDFISLPTLEGAHKIMPNRYYNRLYQAENPEKFEIWHIKRQGLMENRRNIQVTKTSNSYERMLKAMEMARIAATKLDRS